jgi:nicotinamidase-related amidase
MSAILVLIDIQNAIDDPVWGTRGQPDAEANCAKLLSHWRELGNPIVHIRHDSMDPNSPYAPEQPGNEFKSIVAPLEHEPVVEKRTNNAFIGTDLMQVLEEYQTSDLVVCGVLLENSVESTVRMAGNLGFMVYLAIDANGKKWLPEDVHALTLAILDGEYAKVVSSDALMAEPASGTLQ